MPKKPIQKRNANGEGCITKLPNRELYRGQVTIEGQYDENGKPFVYCYDRNGDAVRQSVLLGINNGTIVEIRDGVRTGETVLIPPANIMLPMMKMMNR